MSSAFHLPAAVDQTSRSLTHVATDRLIEMKAECQAWREDMTEFQVGIVSPSARILWDCLCAGEIRSFLKLSEKSQASSPSGLLAA